MAAEPARQHHSGHLAFLGRLGRFVQHRHQAASPCGLVVVHVANLNRINTTAGYRAGQLATRHFAASLTSILRSNDWLMQLTDDRVAMVFDDVRNAGHLALAVNRIVRIADELTLPEGGSAGLETRAGAALYPDHGNTPELLLRHAELAVESARQSQSAFALYRPESARQLTEEWDLETELRTALDNSEFHLCYQPKTDAGSMRTCGLEALLRWNSSRYGSVPPDRFIPVAEDCRIIDSLSEFILHSAARDCADWPAAEAGLNIAVNISPESVEHGNILACIERASAIWGISKTRFTVEVTENGLVSSGGAALEVLHRLRDAGVRVSIDDFGTGNSSLAYFKDIPADEVKIDKSFVMSMFESRANLRLVKSIIDLAHSFELKVVAEGVESAECVQSLQEFGCDYLQGYYFSRPLPQSELVDYLREDLRDE